MEPSDLSLYYFLTYAAAAGGLEPLISAEEGGGQQFKIKVCVFYTLMYTVSNEFIFLSFASDNYFIKAVD